MPLCKSEEQMRVAAFNTNGIQDQNKRRELVESFKQAGHRPVKLR